MTKSTLYTLEEVLAAVDRGITKAGTASVLGVDWDTVNNYCKRWKAVERAFKSKRSQLVDMAELGLRKAILNGEPWAISLCLRTLGKEQGYTERQESLRQEITSADASRIAEALVEELGKRSKVQSVRPEPEPRALECGHELESNELGEEG